MTFGSLFSGIGGLDLGLERAGWVCQWQVEIDPFCVDVLKKHWPEVPKYGDIRSLDSGTLESVGLICGGFPCQPVSVAGRRKGTEDTRWLWPEFARIVCDLRPRFVLIENVPGLRTANGGEAFAEVLGDLARHGYDAEWAGIPAAAVGAPHLRYRVFLVGYSTSARRGSGQPGESGPVRNEAWGAQPERRGGTLAHAYTERWDGRAGVFGKRWRGELANPSWWATEPDVGRVAYGIPARVDRLRALGNAVVPQVAEYVGRLLALNLSEIERGVR